MLRHDRTSRSLSLDRSTSKTQPCNSQTARVLGWAKINLAPSGRWIYFKFTSNQFKFRRDISTHDDKTFLKLNLIIFLLFPFIIRNTPISKIFQKLIRKYSDYKRFQQRFARSCILLDTIVIRLFRKS